MGGRTTRLVFALVSVSVAIPCSAVGANEVDVTLGQSRFRIPRDYLQVMPQAVAVNFVAMWALLPGMEPRQPSNAAQFDDSSPESRVVLIGLRQATKFRYPTPKDQVEDFVQRGVIAREPVAAEFGLVLYPILNKTGPDKNHDYFFGSYGSRENVFLDCLRPGALPSPACRATRHWENGLYLQYDFKAAQLRYWREIDAAVRTKVREFQLAK